MAFSAFTLHKGVCSTVVSDIFLPTCPLLTVDLALLHLLSTCNLALLLVILSTALSPLYYLSLSPSFPDTDAGGPAKVDPEAADAFVMWDLALASPPSSPRLDATPSSRTYGTSVPATPITPASRASPSNPYQSPAKASSASAEGATPPRRRDRFAEGRIWSYVPLAGCSLGVAGTAAFVLHEGKYSAFA